MTPSEALVFVDRILAQVPLKRDENETAKEAVKTLAQMVNDFAVIQKAQNEAKKLEQSPKAS